MCSHERFHRQNYSGYNHLFLFDLEKLLHSTMNDMLVEKFHTLCMSCCAMIDVYWSERILICCIIIFNAVTLIIPSLLGRHDSTAVEDDC